MKLSANQLVTEHIGWMLALCKRILKDHAHAEDATQEALVSAINNLDKFEELSSIKTWLHRITVNAALAKLRKNKRTDFLIEDHLPEFDRLDCLVEPMWGELRTVQDVVDDTHLSMSHAKTTTSNSQALNWINLMLY